ncbi:MAG: cytochrome c oxidase subunit 3 family protein [Bdellovibrionaceae bacterium]|nr:cytochrome c oxidase subunit 3 family protein [Pseudobdellovibrionaceae bacterium]
MASNTHAPTDHKHHYAHHFRNADHEFVSSKEGIWLFMVTEILMFGGLFVGYFMFAMVYPEMFHAGATFLDWRMGAFNTCVLLLSSWTMAMAINSIQTGKNSAATKHLIVTLICGAIFMVVKYFEYTHKIHEGLLPGRFFSYDLAAHPELAHITNLGMYFGFYFSMTGLHGTHVLIGMALITWVLIRNLRGEFDPHYYTAVEGVGIFWHIVDLIWIFLFPLLYLVG